MQHDHVMAVEPEMIETGHNIIGISQQVGDQDHKRAPLHHQCNIVQLPGDGGLGSGHNIAEQPVDFNDNTHSRAWWHIGAYFGIEDGQAH